MKTVAILLAAGQGKRMQSDVKKQYMLIQGKPVLYYSLKTLQDSFMDEIILVSSPGEEAYLQTEFVDRYGFSKVKKIVPGGKERYHSVAYGLNAIENCDYCFIHDGARPFLTKEILERTLLAVKEYQACVAAMPVKDTIKIADEEGFASETPKRDLVWMVQTPQVFSYPLIHRAYNQLLEQEDDLLQKGIKITDDAMVVETFTKQKVKFVEGSYENIKITTPDDIPLAEMIQNNR